ncbi:reticulocyte binding protein, putative, partial [Plasmodium relictum]
MNDTYVKDVNTEHNFFSSYKNDCKNAMSINITKNNITYIFTTALQHNGGYQQYNIWNNQLKSNFYEIQKKFKDLLKNALKGLGEEINSLVYPENVIMEVKKIFTEGNDAYHRTKSLIEENFRLENLSHKYKNKRISDITSELTELYARALAHNINLKDKFNSFNTKYKSIESNINSVELAKRELLLEESKLTDITYDILAKKKDIEDIIGSANNELALLKSDYDELMTLVSEIQSSKENIQAKIDNLQELKRQEDEDSQKSIEEIRKYLEEIKKKISSLKIIIDFKGSAKKDLETIEKFIGIMDTQVTPITSKIVKFKKDIITNSIRNLYIKMKDSFETFTSKMNSLFEYISEYEQDKKKFEKYEGDITKRKSEFFHQNIEKDSERPEENSIYQNTLNPESVNLDKKSKIEEHISDSKKIMGIIKDLLELYEKVEEYFDMSQDTQSVNGLRNLKDCINQEDIDSILTDYERRFNSATDSINNRHVEGYSSNVSTEEANFKNITDKIGKTKLSVELLNIEVDSATRIQNEEILDIVYNFIIKLHQKICDDAQRKIEIIEETEGNLESYNFESNTEKVQKENNRENLNTITQKIRDFMDIVRAHKSKIKDIKEESQKEFEESNSIKNDGKNSSEKKNNMKEIYEKMKKILEKLQKEIEQL